jgi:UDP-N-acetyl-D-glucosamine dehydrogenase
MNAPAAGEPTCDPAGALRGKIDRREAVAGVIGLGYVGLPLALAIEEGGLRVLGFDNDPAKVEALARGRSYIRHIDSGRLIAAERRGRFEVTSDFSRLAEADVLTICVPTPLTSGREPDLRFIASTAGSILATLRAGQLVILASTTYPGTTDGLLRETLEGGGLKAGADFFLAYASEREDPGRTDLTTRLIPKVVGGFDAVSGDLAEAFFGVFVRTIVRVASARTAEASKLAENVFRAVNIALVNELKVVFDRLGIDVWDVLDAAATKPFGFMRFDPGPGWGGHCVPLDPFYLAWRARQAGVRTRFIELAGEVNAQMPDHVVEKLEAALAERGKALRGSRILLLGVAYKRNVDDTRESPAFEIYSRLVNRGATVGYHDELVPVIGSIRRHPELGGAASQELSPETLLAQDAFVIVTDHDGVDYRKIAETGTLVVDTRGVMRQFALVPGAQIVQG